MNRPRKKNDGKQKNFAEKLEAQNSALQKILKAIKEKFNGENDKHKNHQLIFSLSAFLFAMLLFCVSTSAQTLLPSVLASSGNNAEVSGVSLNWTLGEAAINTHSSGGKSICQGFHQAGMIITSSRNIYSSELKFYPNPFTQTLHLNLSGMALPIEAQFIDTSGEIVSHYSFYKTENTLRLEYLKPGMYFLRLSTHNEIRSIKIIKQ